MEFEADIGLEVHVQIKTESKMFTRAPYHFGATPNSQTNPLVMGLPGTLPVLNKAALEKTIVTGLIFDCQIAEICKWDRKNYFYPDQPKNYQISQYDEPVCSGGQVEIELPGPARNIMGEHRFVRITRIHLEEDAGKLSHFEVHTLVDFNRSGAPLMEIVTEPDLHSTDEVYAFLTSLKMHMVDAGISDCDMEKGQLRCDANVSIRPIGYAVLGNKVELKNLNSITGVRNGVQYEIDRQTRVLRRGDRVLQETRHWNADRGVSTALRSKEEAHDYRYFPDPDLMPVKIERSWRQCLKAIVGERPFDRQRRFVEQYDLPYTITSVICPNRELSEYFEEAVRIYNRPREIANFVVNDLLREIAALSQGEGRSLAESKVEPIHIAELVRLIDERTISKQIGQEVFVEMFKTGRAARTIVEEEDLQQASDRGQLEEICVRIIEANPKPTAEFKAGKGNAINALKGQVMKATRGRADPRLIDGILRRLLTV